MMMIMLIIIKEVNKLTGKEIAFGLGLKYVFVVCCGNELILKSTIPLT
jgi:hypothetical protein